MVIEDNICVLERHSEMDESNMVSKISLKIL